MKSSTPREDGGENATSGSLHRIGREARAEAQAFRDSAARSAADLLDSVNAALRAADADALGEAAQSQAGAIERFVAREFRQRPLRAAGVALAIGALVGFLSAR